jgi:hypothetical protein
MCTLCNDNGIISKETICSCCLGRVEGCRYCGGLGFRMIGLDCSCNPKSRTTWQIARYEAAVRDLMDYLNERGN